MQQVQQALITNNVVDGTNGSRVVSIEKSCQDVVVRGNTFRNGGRGSWINQPRNLTMEDNVFEHNTTKCESDPKRGRRSFLTGGYEEYAEMYFTTYEPGGTYGNVILRNNRFVSGPNAKHAITFMPGGAQLLGTMKREGVYAATGYEGVEAHDARLKAERETR